MHFNGAWVVARALVLVLAASAAAIAGVGAQEEAPEAERGGWVRIGDLGLPRTHHTATLLPDETILVVGGTSAAGRPVLTAELVYPRSGATRAAGTLPWGLAGHQAVALPDGRVLLSGSDAYTGGEPVADQDVCADYPPLVWDPATVSFTPVPDVADSNGASVTVVADSRVLFAGGGTACIQGQALAGLDGALTWDPGSGLVEPTGSLIGPRAFGPAVLLDDGRVLVGGGVRLANLPAGASVQRAPGLEAWDPETNEWTSYGRTGLGIDGLLLLEDGTVGVVGEYEDGFGMRIFDPDVGVLRPLSEDQVKPLRGAAVAQLGDRLAFVGGLNKAGRPVPQALLWEPATGTRARLWYPRSGADTGHTATALADGTIVVIGGSDAHDRGRVLASVEAFEVGS
jgi:hypothetical protein